MDILTAEAIIEDIRKRMDKEDFDYLLELIAPVSERISGEVIASIQNDARKGYVLSEDIKKTVKAKRLLFQRSVDGSYFCESPFGFQYTITKNTHNGREIFCVYSEKNGRVSLCKAADSFDDAAEWCNKEHEKLVKSLLEG